MWRSSTNGGALDAGGSLDANGDTTQGPSVDAGLDAGDDTASAQMSGPDAGCNASPDPCCPTFCMDAAPVPACIAEMQCLDAGGTWGPGQCMLPSEGGLGDAEAGPGDAASSDAPAMD